jgi:hypothetical protein
MCSCTDSGGVTVAHAWPLGKHAGVRDDGLLVKSATPFGVS